MGYDRIRTRSEISSNNPSNNLNNVTNHNNYEIQNPDTEEAGIKSVKVIENIKCHYLTGDNFKPF